MTFATLAVGVLVLAYFLYLFRLFSVVIVGLRRKPNCTQSAVPEYSLQSIFATSDLDCDSLILWRAHLAVLRRLRSAGRRGLPIGDIHDLYCKLSRCYPELYEGSTFQDWMSALEGAEVVDRFGSSLISLTDKGMFLIGFVECEATLGCNESVPLHLAT
jgi:hypothetical protein